MKTRTVTPPPLPANATAAADDWLLALDPRPPTLVKALHGRLPRREFTTPQRLWAAAVLLCLGALALWAACAGALHGARAGLKSVGRETAPSILAAGHLRAALADGDANLVNTLLADPQSDPARRAPPGTRRTPASPRATSPGRSAPS